MNANVHRRQLERYFAYVDGEQWDPLFSLFHPRIVYRRGGHPPIDGIEELKAFYSNDRLIASGRHVLDVILTDGDWAVAKGTFQGSLRDASNVEVEFADFHQFRDELIWRRYTYFAGTPV